MKRRGASEQDSLDLLLDTVSNVFGGVMFLTLLAALLILSRGADPHQDATDEAAVKAPSTTLMDPETRRTLAAIRTQQQLRERLDPDGQSLEKSNRLEVLEDHVALAKRNLARANQAVAAQQRSRADQQVQQSELEQQIEALEREVERQVHSNDNARSQSQRTVEFRGLSRSMTAEAVVVLRYGRWYLLQTGKNGKYINQEDFFVRKERRLHRVTPKPHKGNPVTQGTLEELATKLKQDYSPRSFHVVIAVWDDSFTEFNSLKDAVKSAGFQYRTLPCDSSSRLSNRYAADAYVQ